MLRVKRGFTLVEMIVVIGIIAIFFSLVMFSYNSVRNKGKTSRAKSDMVSLGYALNAYNVFHKNDSDGNNIWPRNLYTKKIYDLNPDPVPWEIREGGFWSKTEKMTSGILYERLPCEPNYREYYNSETLEASSTSQPAPYVEISIDEKDPDSTTHASRENACVTSFDIAYVGINWAGIDGDYGFVEASKASDNGFLLLYAEKPIPTDLPSFPNGKKKDGDNYGLVGKFLLKMGGIDEKCPSTGCNF